MIINHAHNSHLVVTPRRQLKKTAPLPTVVYLSKLFSLSLPLSSPLPHTPLLGRDGRRTTDEAVTSNRSARLAQSHCPENAETITFTSSLDDEPTRDLSSLRGLAAALLLPASDVSNDAGPIGEGGCAVGAIQGRDGGRKRWSDNKRGSLGKRLEPSNAHDGMSGSTFHSRGPKSGRGRSQSFLRLHPVEFSLPWFSARCHQK